MRESLQDIFNETVFIRELTLEREVLLKIGRVRKTSEIRFGTLATGEKTWAKRSTT